MIGAGKFSSMSETNKIVGPLFSRHILLQCPPPMQAFALSLTILLSILEAYSFVLVTVGLFILSFPVTRPFESTVTNVSPAAMYSVTVPVCLVSEYYPVVTLGLVLYASPYPFGITYTLTLAM